MSSKPERIWVDALATLWPRFKMLYTKLLFLFLRLVTIGPLAWSLEDIHVVDLGYAQYLGGRSSQYPDSVSYLGLPYAEPPLGERRFRAPLPLNTTRIQQISGQTPVDATQYPEFCVQGTTGGGDAGGAGTEDCLKINVYTPIGTKSGSKLPVLAYIHGGGYVYGNPRNWPFDHWIQQSPNIVIVSIYYRLDSFGFLAVPEFTDSKNGDFNVGFQDQQLGLKWVKQNIAAFGGDPDRVTINGQSAGGSSVELHLVAPASQGLFSGAIIQSVFRAPVVTPEKQQPLFNFYAAQAGCGAGPLTLQLACLRNASISALAQAQDASNSAAFSCLYDSFHPVLDGKIITGHPTQLIISGKSAHVPLIVGATSNETLSGGTNVSLALKEFFPALTDTDISQFLDVYPAGDFDSATQHFQVATGEPDVICGREILGGAYAKYSKAWTYRYNQPNPTSGGTAVNHAAENWMMFLGSNTGVNGTTTFTPMTPVEISFAQELIGYWLSFVRSGNPNTHKLARSPIWSPYTTEEDKIRIVLQQDPLNTTTRSGSFLELEPTKEGRRCQFVLGKVDHEED